MEEPAIENVPCGQGIHVEEFSAPIALENDPAMQEVQFDTPTKFE
jgi:hypothetical protein